LDFVRHISECSTRVEEKMSRFRSEYRCVHKTGSSVLLCGMPTDGAEFCDKHSGK
jgi:hypothetical protein